MDIVVSYDASADNAPAGFKAAVDAAVAYFESQFSNTVVINITFGFGTVQGVDLAGAAPGGAAAPSFDLNYDDLRNALARVATSSDDLAALAALPERDPTGGGDFVVSTALAKTLGLYPAKTDDPDGFVTLNASAVFTYDPNNRAVAGAYDAIGILESQISAILGRVAYAGETQDSGIHLFGPVDLFRYAGGVLSPSAAAASFSLDGHTLLAAFANPAQTANGADWAAGADAFSAAPATGQQLGVSALDVRVMDILGYRGPLSPPVITLPDITPSAAGSVANVAAGQTVYFNQGGVYTAIANPNFTDAGVAIFATPAHDDHVAVDAFFTSAVADVHILPGAQFLAYSPDSSAGAIRLNGGGRVENAGLIEVSTPNGTIRAGVYSDGAMTFVNDATGVIRVWGVAANAVGGNEYSPSGQNSFNNAGLIEAYGTFATDRKLAAIAVWMSSDVVNSGTVRAVSLTPDGYGIAFGMFNTDTFVNSGLIQADYAFVADPFRFAITETRGFPISSRINPTINNSGQIYGHFLFEWGDATVINSGLIAGDIYYGAGDSVYNGAGGTLHGALFLGIGENLVTLGDDGEIVYGGGGEAHITGGAGDDFIAINRGDNVIDGGGGFNTLSYASAAAGITLNLATGVASGGGASTIHNIQKIIGSGQDDTFIAGAGAVQLFGGDGDDHLTGGPGADLLVGGANNDTLTGGGGADTFVHSAGDGRETITDFQIGLDVLKIYGYGAPLSITQSGADTVVRLSQSETVTLQNIQATSLGAGSILYSTTPYAAPNTPLTQPVYGTDYIRAENAFKVYAGETLNLTNPFFDEWQYEVTQGAEVNYTGILFSPAFSSDKPTFDSFGNVFVTYATPSTLVGMTVNDSPGDLLKFEAGSAFGVTNVLGDAWGLTVDSLGPNLDNAGGFYVTGKEVAVGFRTYQPYVTITNESAGVMTAAAAEGVARTIVALNGAHLTNAGTISVTGGSVLFGGVVNEPSAAVYIERFEFGSLVNTGHILATSNDGSAVVGVMVAGIDSVFNPSTFDNQGEITAPVAIQSFRPNGVTPTFVSLTLTNSGVINGLIDLGRGTSTLTNTGAIHGDILITGGSNTLDLRAGTFAGNVRIEPIFSTGLDLTETIRLGAGRSTVKLAAGDDHLKVIVTGQAGSHTTVSFDVASGNAAIVHNGDGSWTVTSADGVITASHVETLHFTDRDIVLARAAPSDFNLDGKSDVLWRNDSGELYVWNSQSGQGAFLGQTLGNPGTAWHVQAVGDYDGDGKADVLWRNNTGDLYVYKSANASTVSFTGQSISYVDPVWQIVPHAGDFDGDGRSDILYRNSSTGEVYLWNSNTGADVSFVGQSLGVVGSAWHIQGVDDFNGDGRADVLWRNDGGDVYVWTATGSDNNVGVAGQTISSVPNDWSIIGTGDFNGDGRADILWRHAGDGELYVWNSQTGSNAVNFVGQSLGVVGLDWSVAAIGDYDGDGRADILFRNADGRVYVWKSNDTGPVGFTGQGLGTTPTDWHILSDFHGM